MRTRVMSITVLGIFSGIIALMALVPQLGFIQLGFIALTIIHIPVLIGGYFGGPRVAIGLGLAFGLASFSQALIRPVTPVDLLFQNPLISVLPRLLFGLTLAVLTVRLKLFRSDYLNIPLVFAISTLSHTVFVLGSFYVFSPFFNPLAEFTETVGGFLPFLWSVLVANGFFEIGAAILLAGPIAVRVKDALRLGDGHALYH